MATPRNVRNFWLTASIDGRKTRLRGGPRSHAGGMTVWVEWRSGGVPQDALVVHCYRDEDDGGRLKICVKVKGVWHTISTYPD